MKSSMIFRNNGMLWTRLSKKLSQPSAVTSKPINLLLLVLTKRTKEVMMRRRLALGGSKITMKTQLVSSLSFPKSNLRKRRVARTRRKNRALARIKSSMPGVRMRSLLSERLNLTGELID